MSRALVLTAAIALGCTHADDYLIVTVDARPAVRDARSIAVTLVNAGATHSDTFALRDQPFPVTFSISAPGRTGDLQIAVDAHDGARIVGRGSTSATVEAARASVMLDATDFVVNTDYAGDQFPSDNAEAGGFQVAARPDGTWTAVFRDACMADACTVFARQFDPSGKPVATQAAAGSNAFAVTARPTASLSIPAIAAGQTTAVAVWNFFDTGAATTSGVACRAIDGTGRLGADQIALDTVGASVVSVAALAGGNFAATWRVIGAGGIDQIRMVIVHPDCSPLGAAQAVATGGAASDFLHRGQIAGSADHVLVAWVTNGDVHARLASSAGAFLTPDTLLASQTQTDRVESVRAVAASGGGFVVGARWAQKASTTGPGRIEVYRVDAAGARIGGPTVVSDQTGSDIDASNSFAMASRPDGTVLVAWHACGMLGDGSLCGVFGRLLRDTGDALGDAFAIPTTIDADQQLPSVAALPDGFVAVWSDASEKAPDGLGKSVRARILYPPSGATAP
ncbi:MAG: hypothetical protein E6J91_46610 [Deltaproteobacteria bacterium]|nr:MAG: hypothetical protein E6J91_46610 [Deltaproteobacteria bacterium]